MSAPEQEIERAERAYRAGDFRTARRIAGELLAQTTVDDDIGERAARITRATGIDPLAIAFFGITLGLLLFLILWYFL
jgi:hypothetical protein